MRQTESLLQMLARVEDTNRLLPPLTYSGTNAGHESSDFDYKYRKNFRGH